MSRYPIPKYVHYENLPDFSEDEIHGLLRCLHYHLIDTLKRDVTNEEFVNCLHTLRKCHSLKFGYGTLGFLFPFTDCFPEMPYKTVFGYKRVNNTAYALRRFFYFTKPTAKVYKKLVLNIPHASPKIDKRFYDDSWHKIQEGTKIQNDKMIDWFTDELFMPDSPLNEIEAIVAKWNRLLCDVERLPHDPLEKKGMGITSRDVDIYLFRNKDEIVKTYVNYQRQLEDALTNDSLLVDCHSFSPDNPLIANTAATNIDICIGFNDDFSKPSEFVLGTVEHHFISHGYSVAFNKPFSNSKTVGTPVQYHSLMIEVNKRTYMDEEQCKKTEGFERLHKVIMELYPKLLVSGKEMD